MYFDTYAFYIFYMVFLRMFPADYLEDVLEGLPADYLEDVPEGLLAVIFAVLCDNITA